MKRPVLSYKLYYSWKKKCIEHKMCVLVSSTTLNWNSSCYRRTQTDTLTNVPRSSCKVFVVLVRCKGNLNFADRFSNSAQITNSMQIRPLRAEFFLCGQMDRRTDWHDDVRSRCSAMLRTRLKTLFLRSEYSYLCVS